MDLKDALLELIDDPGYEIIDVRVGEKLHESLISKYEKLSLRHLIISIFILLLQYKNS